MKYERPQYSVAVITEDGTKYCVKNMGESESNIITSLSLSEPDGQLAQKVTMKVADMKIPGKNGGYPSVLFSVKSRVFVYAKGVGVETKKEVFRGFIWENRISNSQKKELELTCYDNLIYFMKSETSMFFSRGKLTKAVVSAICKKWGIKVKYSYLSITHPKLPLSGTLADVFTADILDSVKKKKGTEYVIRSVKDVMNVLSVGKNTTVYNIDKGGRGVEIEYTRTTTMEGLVTKVVITGKTDKAGKTKIEAAVRKNTKKYGTLQKVINKDEDTKLKEIRAEAQTVLREHAQPETKYEVTALDIPWIRKGDKVGVCFNNDKIKYCIVRSITHDAVEGTMVMEVRRC